MNYIVHYDYAALIVIITVLIFYAFKKSISTSKTKVFVVLVLCIFIATVMDIITVHFIQNSSEYSFELNCLVNELYYITAYVVIPVAYYIYIFIATNNENKYIIKRWIVYIPAIISAIFIITTDMTKLIFYFDENSNYVYGDLRFILYIVAGVYIAIAILHTYNNRRELSVRQEFSIYFFTISLFLAMITQMFVRGLLVMQFSMAIAVLVLYLSLENPDDYSDKQLGVFNKIAFRELYKEYIRNKKPFKILVIKVEGLKYINEIMGNKAVDSLMRQVSYFLGILDRKCYVFRISDSKFALLSTEDINWNKITDKIKERFNKSFKAKGVDTTLSSLMCMISYPDKLSSDENVQDMVEYGIAKAATLGDDVVLEIDETILEEGRREHNVIQIMRQALRDGTFEIFYQPIYSVEKKRYTSAEALIRLNSKELGYISPDEFIPLAEKNGMILEIGEYVFTQVCDFMAEEKLWEKGIEYIDVNLSVVQCMQEKLYERLIEIMDKYNLKYTYINLEITETAAIMSSETLQWNMERLMEKGIKFSLDDYGTGFSNTTNLINYKFHTIKIDKSMVWAAMDNEKAMCALEYTIGMVKAMNMLLVAEGVETLEQANELTRLGCDFFQGYYYSRPVCKADFYEKISKQCA